MPVVIPAVYATVEVYRVHHGPGSSYTEYPRSPSGQIAANLLAQVKGGCQVTEEDKQLLVSDEQVIED